jgi:pantothenate kinase-related protein Tda10
MDRLTELARRLLRKGGRTILGITGPPGAGKSTIAAIVDAVGASARLVGMDGFHLAHAELIRLGRVDRRVHRIPSTRSETRHCYGDSATTPRPSSVRHDSSARSRIQ